MGSKSVLLLGIVFVFLLNVIAVHNYINDYYYKTEQENTLKKIDLESEIFTENRSKKSVSNITENTTKQEDHKEDIKRIHEEIINYKSHYANQIANEKKSWNKLFQEHQEKKRAQNSNKTIKKVETNIKQDNNLKDIKVDHQDALITLDLNVNDNYIDNNPIIKKIADRFNDDKIIEIIIHKYSMKIKDYLEKVKGDFANHGIDVDDIKVIYKKDQNKKDKIKIILTKKD